MPLFGSRQSRTRAYSAASRPAEVRDRPLRPVPVHRLALNHRAAPRRLVRHQVLNRLAAPHRRARAPRPQAPALPVRRRHPVKENRTSSVSGSFTRRERALFKRLRLKFRKLLIPKSAAENTATQSSFVSWAAEKASTWAEGLADRRTGQSHSPPTNQSHSKTLKASAMSRQSLELRLVR